MSIVVVTALSVLAGAVVFVLLAFRASRRVERSLGVLDGRDLLTGLPDRSALREALAQRTGAGARSAVLLVEFDRFAAVNDVYGHDVGDELLLAMVEQLRGALADHEQLFRYTGPQFAIVCPSVATTTAAEQRARALQEAIQVRYRVRHDHLRLSATVAGVVLDQRHTDAAVAERDLVAALEEGHRRGAGAIAIHEVAMNDRLVPLHADRQLRDALEREEFALLYLPVVNLADDSIAGVEALLRWIDPQRGLVAPGEFLGALESSDVLGPVTEWIIRAACRDARAWADAFPDSDLVSTINMSPGQLALPGLDRLLLGILAEERVDPRRVCLEITEGAATAEADGTWTALRAIKDAGVQLALDDFGTGSSTFTYLRRFNLDVLKIDRVFVQKVADSNEDFAIVQQLVAMAHNLDYVAIAEGVDTEDQLEALIGAGCDLAQGYLWSQPVTREAVEAMLRKGTIRPGVGSRAGIDWSAPAR